MNRYAILDNDGVLFEISTPTTLCTGFDKGGPLSELLMLGNIATLYPEETLSYDPAEGRVTNKAEANVHLGFEYRAGWEI